MAEITKQRAEKVLNDFIDFADDIVKASSRSIVTNGYSSAADLAKDIGKVISSAKYAAESVINKKNTPAIPVESFSSTYVSLSLKKSFGEEPMSHDAELSKAHDAELENLEKALMHKKTGHKATPAPENGDPDDPKEGVKHHHKTHPKKAEGKNADAENPHEIEEHSSMDNESDEDGNNQEPGDDTEDVTSRKKKKVKQHIDGRPELAKKSDDEDEDDEDGEEEDDTEDDDADEHGDTDEDEAGEDDEGEGEEGHEEDETTSDEAAEKRKAIKKSEEYAINSQIRRNGILRAFNG